MIKNVSFGTQLPVIKNASTGKQANNVSFGSSYYYPSGSATERNLTEYQRNLDSMHHFKMLNATGQVNLNTYGKLQPVFEELNKITDPREIAEFVTDVLLNPTTDRNTESKYFVATLAKLVLTQPPEIWKDSIVRLYTDNLPQVRSYGVDTFKTVRQFLEKKEGLKDGSVTKENILGNYLYITTRPIYCLLNKMTPETFEKIYNNPNLSALENFINDLKDHRWIQICGSDEDGLVNLRPDIEKIKSL